ncbi:PRD domain-containing protein [Saccharibacillus sp. CPCC 101409]|uniref:BglG family transcription antiterminator LicT n=1 Tax=Saccharibacillus sp. CPCC 101409 TaxID=3058041 RepID=UPI002672AD74|nr:PRD domain-containing protein [Saccharibacillus sp. CPCC 101409]MDO3408894.1 PRD domain-containing protein [Saccharibacillus sp. CPCC 101409]
MILKRALNNNVVLAEDERGEEVIATGRGIAFNLKPGDSIAAEKIAKLFVVKTGDVVSKLTELLQHVRVECVEAADETIRYAKTRLSGSMSEYIYPALIDHISFAVQRDKQGQQIENRMLWEIKRFYREEFAVGLHALKIVEEKTGIAFDENEAGFIAMHFVNARMDQKGVNLSQKTTRAIKDVLDLVKYHFRVEIDEESWNYNRFITHLKFFFQRLFAGEPTSRDYIDLFEELTGKFPQEYACVQKIAVYVRKRFGQELGRDEMIYLMLHISRLVNRTEE